jgi:hypothetical protein
VSERRLVSGFVIPDVAASRELAGELTPPVAGWGVTPSVRQGTVVTNDYTTSPPTCTVILGDSGAQIAGVRYLSPYAPVANDLVQLVNAGGDLWILGRLHPGSPTGTHMARYTQTGTPSLASPGTAFISYSSKDSNGLSEPQGALDSGLPTSTFVIPFDSWWEIEPTITWDQSVNGIGLQIQTSASKLKSNINGGSVLLDPIMTLCGKRWLAAGTNIRIRWQNVTGLTINMQADGTTTPCDVIFRSLGTRTSQ